MISLYRKKLIFSFLKHILKVSLFFLSLILILNVLEEIKFFKNLDNNFFLPIFLTLLNSSSILFEIFPFIFLIGTMNFFIEILDKNELVIYKSVGLPNIKILGTIIGATFLAGIFLVVIFYNISSNLKFLYFDIKNDHTKDDKYLAVITANGLWIKDQIDESIFIINAAKLNGTILTKVLINEFDKNYNFVRLINSQEVDIQNNDWVVKKSYITKDNITSYDDTGFILKTNFNSEKILKLFSNLSSLNFWQLQELRNDYKSLGYSTAKLDIHFQFLLSYPFYLSIMVCIAAILMLNIGHNKPRIMYLVSGILVSVLIYYLNYLFNLLIESQKIPFMFSIWAPQFLLLLICSVGLVRINEK